MCGIPSVNWFNPFVWLLIRSIKELQEMEADKDVLDNGYDREQYQINLVLTCTENKEWILAKSNYNYSSLKSRILFMNKQIKNGRSRIIALTASISFWGVTGFVMAQTAEKNTQNLTHNTPHKPDRNSKYRLKNSRRNQSFLHQLRKHHPRKATALRRPWMLDHGMYRRLSLPYLQIWQTGVAL